MGRLIGVKEAATRLNISHMTLYDWRKNRNPNRPPEYKIGRRLLYDREELDEWLENQKAKV